MPEQATSEDWVSTSQAGDRLGYAQVTIWRMCKAGELPSMRAGKEFRLPRRLVEDAISAVMAGGSIDLREFAQQWTAHRTEPAEAVA